MITFHDMTLKGVLIAGRWRRKDELPDYPKDPELFNQMMHGERNTIIVELNGHSNFVELAKRFGQNYYQQFNNDELIGKAAVIIFLRDAGICTRDDLQKMTDSEQRERLINENHTHTSLAITELQTYTNQWLVQVGLSWLPPTNTPTDPRIQTLYPVTLWTLKHVFADISGNGILYTISDDGKLSWHKYSGVSGGTWDNNSGKELPGITELQTYKHVFSGGNGIIYAVAGGDKGGLTFMKDLKQDGSIGLVTINLEPVGMWNQFQHIFSAGSGTIYGIDEEGGLYWLKDIAQSGKPNWLLENEKKIGTGWKNYKHVFSGANGVIYAVSASGDLLWFQNLAQDGSLQLANGSGTVISQGWEDFRKVFSDGNNVIYGLAENGELRRYTNMAVGNQAIWDSYSDKVIQKGWVCDVSMNVMNRGDIKLVSEVTNIAVTPFYEPLLTLDTQEVESYINYSELNSAGVPSSFNNIDITYTLAGSDTNQTPQYQPSIQTKDIHISGLVINWKQNLQHSILKSVFKDLNGTPRIDIQNLIIYADTVIIGRPLHFPQTNITIYARRLIVSKDGKLNTTPLAFGESLVYPPLKPGQAANPAQRSIKYETNPGADGASAGNINLHIKYLDCSEVPDAKPWLIANGSDGQKGEKGGLKESKDFVHLEPVGWDVVKEGVISYEFIGKEEGSWHWPDGMKSELIDGKIVSCITIIYNQWAPPGKMSRTHKEYGNFIKGGRFTIQGQQWFKSHPKSGTDAYNSGMGGLGGNAGIISATVSIPSCYSEILGGQGGVSEFVAGGQPDAKAEPMYIKLYTVVHNDYPNWPAGGAHSTEAARISPCKGDDSPQRQANPGKPGEFKQLDQPFRWLHPNSIAMVIQYAKDMFLKGDRRPAKNLLLHYQNAFKTMPEAERTLLLSHHENEITLIRSRAIANVDYFGNLPGWTPRLAAVTQFSLFHNILPIVANALFLCRNLLNQDARLHLNEEKVTGFIQHLNGQLMKAQTTLQASVDNVERVQAEMNTWEGDVTNITTKIKLLHDAIVSDEKLNAEKQAIFKGALQICSGIVKCIPFGQPYLGEAAGGVMDAVSNIDITADTKNLASNFLGGFQKASAGLGDYLAKNKKDLSEASTSDISKKIDAAQGDLSKVDENIADATKKADAAVKKKFGAQIAHLNFGIEVMNSIRSKKEYDFFNSDDYSDLLAESGNFMQELERIEKDASIDKKKKLNAEAKKMLYKNFSELESEKKDLIAELKTLKKNKDSRAETIKSVVTKFSSVAKGAGDILGGVSTLITPIDTASNEFKARIKKVEDTKYKAEFDSLNKELEKFTAKKQKAMAKLLDTFDAINTSGQQISSSLIQSARLSEQRAQLIQGQLLPTTQIIIKQVLQDAKELLIEQTYYLIKSYEYAYLKKCPITEAFNMAKLADEVAQKLENGEQSDPEKYRSGFEKVINMKFTSVLRDILEKNQFEGAKPKLYNATLTIMPTTKLSDGRSFLEALNIVNRIEVNSASNVKIKINRRQVMFKLHELVNAGILPSGGEVLSKIVSIKFDSINTDNVQDQINFEFSINHSGDSIIRDYKDTNNYYFFTSKTPIANEAIVLPVRTWAGNYQSDRKPHTLVEATNSGQRTDEELLTELLKQLNEKDINITYKEVYPGATSDLTLIIDQKEQDNKKFNITGIQIALEYEGIPIAEMNRPSY